MAEIKEEMSLVHKVLKLKLTYFGHVVRSDHLKQTFQFEMGNGKRGRGRPRRMDGRGDGDNGSATSTAEGSSSRQGGMERCSQSHHQWTYASLWNKVTR